MEVQEDLFETSRLSGQTGIRRICANEALSAARELLIAESNRGSVYKMHSTHGDFVQSSSHQFRASDEERILFLRALSDLQACGFLLPVAETKKVTIYTGHR